MKPSRSAPLLAKAIGPFKGSQKPAAGRLGLYLRVSPKTGQIVWSYYGGGLVGWYAYSDTKSGAVHKYERHKMSKHQNLVWYGAAVSQ